MPASVIGPSCTVFNASSASLSDFGARASQHSEIDEEWRGVLWTSGRIECETYRKSMPGTKGGRYYNLRLGWIQGACAVLLSRRVIRYVEAWDNEFLPV